MKVHIYADECYPFFYLTESIPHYQPWSYIEMSKEDLKKYEEYCRVFREGQDWLEELNKIQPSKYPDGVLKRTPEESADMKKLLLEELQTIQYK